MKQKTLNTTVSENESKHTPGKWKVNHHKDVIHVENKYFIVCEIDKAAAIINDPLNDEVNANARLIAAAPDMLEALKRAQIFVAAFKHGPDVLSTHSNTYVLDKIKAAIAKATNNQ